MADAKPEYRVEALAKGLRLLSLFTESGVELSDDYFAVPESEIAHLRSVLTVLATREVDGTAGAGAA